MMRRRMMKRMRMMRMMSSLLLDYNIHSRLEIMPLLLPLLMPLTITTTMMMMYHPHLITVPLVTAVVV
jgi:hypothetical protein